MIVLTAAGCGFGKSRDRKEIPVKRPAGTTSLLSTHVPLGNWLNGGRLSVAARELGNKITRAHGRKHRVLHSWVYSKGEGIRAVADKIKAFSENRKAAAYMSSLL